VELPNHVRFQTENLQESCRINRSEALAPRLARQQHQTKQTKQNRHHHTSTRPQSHHKTHKHRPTKRQQQTARTRATTTKGKARCKRAQENYTSRQGKGLSGCNTAGNLETTSLWHSDQAKINALLTPISGNILQYCSICVWRLVRRW